MKTGEQRVRIDGILSSLQVLISAIPQRAFLPSFPFLYIFLNDFLEVFKNSNIYNFADDNTDSVGFKNRDTFLETLKNVSGRKLPPGQFSISFQVSIIHSCV